ncbi:unnamed protein product [Rotaria socialis]|uniref:Uncharacterized protein n=1 Tax=Rotaria socialis TaxID=392032 RepID=A0A817ZL62_9BILA|nr:unnamed protein product [Rotaria socialis]CAF3553552.1 unnamed protein product [Rotaria socialis]CAF4267678.1 unnamed protein product [Rotaria socialis]
MAVIDWLQTSEFIRQHSESFILYSLCGCFVGVTFILLTIIIVLYIEKRHVAHDENNKIKHDYQTPRSDIDYNDILSTTRSYLPVYRYDGRTHHEFYDV